MKTFIISLILIMSSVCSWAQVLDGTWKGTLKAGPQTLTLVLNITKVENKVTLDVVEQGAKDMPTVVNALTADSLNISIPQLTLHYAGKMSGGKLKGIFMQQAFTAPLVFESGSVVANRPQEPKPPYPYATEEVLFWNYPENILLAGTLTYPIGYEEKGKVPVVLMVTGSGQQNRDEELFGHKPFLVIADWLARHGIASLRYDDRGAGASLGDHHLSTTREFCFDASAGIDYLRGRNKFGPIGILGHSEGGAIGYMLASEKKVDFVVSLAGPACKIEDMMVVQINSLAHAQGLADDLVHSPKEAYDFLKGQTGESAWLNYFFQLDMAEYVRKTTCPVLALGGERDLNVPVSINVPALKENLPDNPRNIIKTYPGLSHMFQHNPTGNPLLSATIEETFAEEVLKDISDFINGL